MSARVLVTQRKIALCKPTLEALLCDILRAAGQPASAVGLCVASDARLRALNSTYRGKRSATDVLSFSAQAWRAPGVLDAGAAVLGARDATGAAATGASAAPGCDLGDDFVSAQYALRWATRHGLDADAHLATLLIHGVVHLLGYDHEDDADAADMAAAEGRVLAALECMPPWPRKLHLSGGGDARTPLV